MDWLHTEEELHQSAQLEIPGAYEIFCWGGCYFSDKACVISQLESSDSFFPYLIIRSSLWCLFMVLQVLWDHSNKLPPPPLLCLSMSQASKVCRLRQLFKTVETDNSPLSSSLKSWNPGCTPQSFPSVPREKPQVGCLLPSPICAEFRWPLLWHCRASGAAASHSSPLLGFKQPLGIWTSRNQSLKQPSKKPNHSTQVSLCFP